MRSRITIQNKMKSQKEMARRIRNYITETDSAFSFCPQSRSHKHCSAIFFVFAGDRIELEFKTTDRNADEIQEVLNFENWYNGKEYLKTPRKSAVMNEKSRIEKMQILIEARLPIFENLSEQGDFERLWNDMVNA